MKRISNLLRPMTTSCIALAVALAVATCTEEASVGTGLEGDMPTVTEQVTPTGRVILERDAFIRILAGQTFPWRFRVADADGNILHEHVVREPEDVARISDRARDAFREARRRIKEEPGARAAKRQDADEWVAALRAELEAKRESK